jgi:hypothetical protein
MTEERYRAAGAAVPKSQSKRIRVSMSQRRQEWRIGSVSLIGTKNGKSAVGQVVGQEPQVPNSASIALLDLLVDSENKLDQMTKLRDSSCRACPSGWHTGFETGRRYLSTPSATSWRTP